MLKQSILVAALTAFLFSLTLQTASAQPAEGRWTPVASFRSRLYCRPRCSLTLNAAPRLGIFSRCRFTTYAQPTPSTLTMTPEKVEFTPSCPGGTCVVDPVGRDEYVPTDAGNVPAEEYRGTKTASWLAAVNRTRAAFGLSRLRGDATLDAGCKSAANYCASVGGLVHTGGNEILAYNSSGIDVAIQTWLQSPAHRAYLLSPSFTSAGVSVVRDRYGRVWCAVRFR